MDALVVLTTVATKEDAERLGRALVERKLAACAQILGPMTSIYRWKGAVQQEPEHLCLLKTRRERFAELEAAIRELHPYETPEIIALPVTAGSAAYLAWLEGETR